LKIDFNKALALVDVLPGQKRTLTCLFALGMLVCQIGSHWGYGHVFSATEWASVGITGGIFYQLKLIREEKEKKE
jgi:hypothetical protein